MRGVTSQKRTTVRRTLGSLTAVQWNLALALRQVPKSDEDLMSLAEERRTFEAAVRAQWIGRALAVCAVAIGFVTSLILGATSFYEVLILTIIGFFAVCLIANALLFVFARPLWRRMATDPDRSVLNKLEAEENERHAAQLRLSEESEQRTRREARYGERHQELRRHWAEIIVVHGGTCSERICVMPSRRIMRGAYFHLAHDHQAGGASDYLGPAHPECNEHEARLRGVAWAPKTSRTPNLPDAGDPGKVPPPEGYP